MLLDFAYTVALLLGIPYLLVRSLRTGRYRNHIRDKLIGPGTPLTDNSRPVAWFHGVSVGEVHLLRQVVREFRERHPDWQLVVSATTDTGLAEARKHFPDLTVVPYPFDFSWAVRRALRAVNPRLIVLAESEMWPNFLRAANRAGIPVVLINGRMSPRSARRYARVAGLARRLVFDRVTAFAMQSERYAANLRDLGIPADRVRVAGNVKYDGVAADRNSPKTRDLGRLLGLSERDLVWVAGSTHDPEERIALDVYGRLRSRFPTLRLVIVPRAPERFDEVARMIESAGHLCVRRSRLADTPATPGDGVILIDTLGELGAAWGLAAVGFTGGSLNDKRGGQSMIEPAGLGVPVLFGPHTWNFKDAVAGLLEIGGAVSVDNELQLDRELERLLADPQARARIGAAGRAFVQAQQGATRRAVDIIDEVITRASR